MAKVYPVTCPSCKQQRELSAQELQKIMATTTNIRHPSGGNNSLRTGLDIKPQRSIPAPWVELIPCPYCQTKFYYNYKTGESKIDL